MRNLPTQQVNILDYFVLLKKKLEEFLIDWQAYVGEVDPGIILRLVKAHMEDVLMPMKYGERVCQVLYTAFPSWYVVDKSRKLQDPAFHNHLRASVSLHQEYLEDPLYMLEQMLLGLKLPENCVWEIIFGPYGSALIVPINPYGEEPKPAERAKLICSNVVRDTWLNKKYLRVHEIPATLDDDDLDPNQFIINADLKGSRQIAQNYHPARRLNLHVVEQDQIPEAFTSLIQDAIRERANRVESKYHSNKSVQRLPHGYKRV